ncbi:MAG: hypothetical protein KDE27_00895, partial [Planctomycetes bacterium]|nr:hypothetical protein [Planctomycetota bacterium]
ASVVQLGLHGHALLPGQRLARDTETPVHEFLRRRAAADPHGGFTIARAGQPATAPTMLPPGQLMARGLRDLNFYNHGDGRSIEPLRALLGNAWSQLGRSYLTKILPPDRLGHPLFDLLGVRYVLSTQPLAQAGVRVGPSIRGPGGGEFYVYERATALPRAYTVSALRRCGGDEGVLTAMIDPATRYDDLALVAWAERDEPPPSPSPPREVRFLQDDPTVVELDIAAGAREHLVLTDTWFPGWRATIDGAPAVIERCNHSMRLVRLPNTACRVRFEFHSVLVPWGVALGLSGLLGLLLAVVLASRRRPTSSGVTSRDETAG